MLQGNILHAATKIEDPMEIYIFPSFWICLLFFFFFAKYIFYHPKKTCVSPKCIEIFRLVIQAQFSLKTNHDLCSVSQGSLILFHTLEIYILRNFIFLPFL